MPQTSAVEIFDTRSMRHVRSISLGFGPGSLTVMEAQVDPFFAGGTPGLPDLDGTISYGPFQINWTGTAAEGAISGSFSGNYEYDETLPELPSATISGSFTTTPVGR